MITLKNSVGRVLLAGLIYMLAITLPFMLMFGYLIGFIAQKISETKKILCNGSAESVMGKIFGNAGWLMLCEDEIIFKSNKFNFDNRSITIPLQRIKNLTVKSRKFVVECIDKTFTFNVVDAKQWREITHNHIVAKMNGAQ